MRFRTLPMHLTVLLLLAACSGGMTMQEYFTQLEGISDTLQDKSDTIQADAEERFNEATDEAEAMEVLEDVLTQLGAVSEEALAGLEELEPPDEVKEAHERFMEAARAGDEALSSALEEVKGADPADIGQVIDSIGNDIDAASQESEAACDDLQKVADDNEIDIDLRCGDDTADDKAAQSSLRNSVAAAKVIFTDTDDYSGVTVDQMAYVEPSLDYVDSATPSTGPNEISIYTDGDMVYAAAALSDSGTCFWVKDDATSGTTFGSGPAESCTGMDATGAADSAW